MKKRILAMLMSLVLMIGIMPMAALATEDDAIEAAVFWYDFADAWLYNVRNALDKELTNAGVSFTNYDAMRTQATQNDQIDTAISQGADVLVVNIVDTAAIHAAQAIVDKAAAADLPIIFFNREVSDSVIDSYENACFVGTRAAMAGAMQGKMAADYIIENYDAVDLNDDGQISYIMMKGELGNPEAEARTRYSVEFCNNALANAEKPELVYYDVDNEDCFQPSNWSKNEAFNLMETALTTNPMNGDAPIEVVFTNNDDAALGCIEALNNVGYNTGEGKSIPVFGIDCTADAMAAMEAGKMTGSVLQSADGMAETVTALVNNVANGENVFANADENFVVDTDGTAKIRVPYEMVLEGEPYETDFDYDYEYDYDFGWDFEGAEGECGDNLTWVIDSDWNLTISGEGPMWDFDEETPTWTWHSNGFNEVTIEEGVTYIGNFAFNESHASNIYIPSTVSNIGEMAFAWSDIGGIWVDAENEAYSSDEYGILYNGDMTELINVTAGIYDTYYVPATVEVIKNYAFFGEYNIFRLVFEGDAPEFEEESLMPYVGAIFYPENNPTWTEEVMQSVENYATWISYDPENPDFTLYGDCGDDLEWVIDDEGTLTISGEGAMWSYDEEWPTWFAFSDAILNVALEEGVTEIGAYAFDEMYIENVYIPASVTRIAPSAFQYATIIEGVWVDEDNKNYRNDDIGVLYEKDLEVLIKAPWNVYEEYTIPEGVVAIEANAFESCDFEGIVLPESLEVISDGAFAGCWNVTSMNIPANVNIIGVGAFTYCNAEKFIVDEDNKFYSNDEFGVLFNKEKTEIIQAPWTLEGTYVVPEGVEVIGGAAFAMGENISELQLPDTLTYIASEAFASCYAVSEITLPESVRFVGDWAFSGSLEILTVKGNNTTFSEYAFDNCWNLRRIVFEGDAPQIFGDFFYWPGTSVYYPEGNETWTEEFMDAYYGALFMSYDPENPDFSIRGECGDNLTWKVDDDWNLIISGEGAMWDYPEEWPTWTDISWGFNAVIIEEGVTHIGSYAFFDNNINNIYIPSTVSSIGEMAFTEAWINEGIWVDGENENYSNDELGVLYNGDKTELIHIHDAVSGTYYVPATVEVVKDFALYGGWQISKLIFEGNAPEFEEAALNGYDAIIFYPDNSTWTEDVIQSVENYATWISYDPENPDFSIRGECGDNLTWKLDDEGVLTISGEGDMWDFDYNESPWSGFNEMVYSVVIEDGVTSIGYNAFNPCYNLESVYLPNTVTLINHGAFQDCVVLPEINIPASVTEIAHSAFNYCSEMIGIWVDEENPNYSSDENGILLNKDKTELVKVPCRYEGDFEVAAGVETIGDSAFTGCERITSIIIPESITNISDFTFNNCDILEKIIVDEDNQHYTSDEMGVLFNAEKTKLICVPRTMIGSYIIPDGVVEIGIEAFVGCGEISSIYIPASLTNVRSFNLKGSFNLTEIIVDEENPNYCSENGLMYNKDKTELVFVPDGIEGTIVIPESVKIIKDNAFSYCSNITEVQFTGDAPSFENYSSFYYPVEISYPADNPTWTEEVMASFGDEITWIPYTPSDRIQGDVDGNGELSNADIIMVARYVIELYDEDTVADIENYGDMDGDGKITNSDIITMARKLVGLV